MSIHPDWSLAWRGEMTTGKAFILFFLFFVPSSLSFLRYSGATCGLAFVFVYPSLIYMISLHRAGQLTWPALIIHIFIILLGLANLIAQFLLWKLPFLPWLSQLVLRYLATALSNTVRHEDRPQCGDLGKSFTFETNSKHIIQVLYRKHVLLHWNHMKSYEKWNGSHLSDTVLLVLLKMNKKLMTLKYFNILQHISPNTKFLASSCGSLSSKWTVLTLISRHAFSVLFTDSLKCSFVAVIFLICLENEEFIVFLLFF